MSGRRPPAEPPRARIPWEEATRDLPAVLARVRTGETVLLTEGERVIAHVAPPPRSRSLRPRPVFGVLAHLLPKGADLRHFTDPEHDRLPEDELRLWEGDSPKGGAEAPDGEVPGQGATGADANAAILRGIEASIGMIPNFPDPDTLAPAPPARAALAA